MTTQSDPRPTGKRQDQLDIRDLRWALMLPVVCLALLVAAVLFYQPAILAPTGFEIWAARPWLMPVTAIITGCLALAALVALPWRRAAVSKPRSITPSVVLLALAFAVGYAGATLSYGVPQRQLNAYQLAVLQARMALSGHVTPVYVAVNECVNDYLFPVEETGSDASITPEAARQHMASQCACPSSAISVANERGRDERATLFTPYIDWQWRVVDCNQIAMDVQYSAAPACAFFFANVTDRLGVTLHRAGTSINPVTHRNAIREFFMRWIVPKRYH